MKLMQKIYTYRGLAALGSVAPLVSLADAEVQPAYISGIFTQVGELIATTIPILIALGLLFFIWGLVQFIFASGDEAAKDEGKRKMIWGVIALFVIVTVWGFVALLNQLTGVDQTNTAEPVTTGPAAAPAPAA